MTAKPGDKVLLGGEEWTVVSAYTRARAIEDGELVDVTEAAARVGLILPTVVTRAVWSAVASEGDGEDPARIAERLRRLLWSAVCAATRAKPRADRVDFTHEQEGMPLALWIHCGPDDDGKPALTILEQGED